MWKWYSPLLSKKGSAIIITMVMVAIFIAYSFVLTSTSLANSRESNQYIANMGALYLAESGLDTFLLRLQADPENAIQIPLSSVDHPGVGEDWQGITLSDGIHYFISPMMFLPRERLVAAGVIVPELTSEDGLMALPHAEDGTGISASDVVPANRKIFSNAMGSFFLRVAYFHPNGPDGIAGNGDDAFVPWAGDHDASGIEFDSSKFAIQLSAVVHLLPRGETQVSVEEGYLDLNSNGIYESGTDEVVEINGTAGQQNADYRRVQYAAVRIVEGSLRNNSEPDITKLIAGAIINLGVNDIGGVGGELKFDNPSANSIIKGQLLSNTGMKVGSTSVSTATGFNSSFQTSANYVDENGFPIFKYGWLSQLLATTDSLGNPIVWNALDIVNPVDGTRLFKAPYSLVSGEIVDSSVPPKPIPSEYLDLLKPSLYGTPDQLDTGLVTPGSDSQLFNINQYLAAAAGTKVIDPSTGSVSVVAGKYFKADGTLATGTVPGRTATGDINWADNASAVAFQGPAGWVFKNEEAFGKMMSLRGELQGVVVVNYTTHQDLTSSLYSPIATGVGMKGVGNLGGVIKVKGTLVFRFNNTFLPDDKIKIAAQLLVNPATFPTYPLTQGLDGGTAIEQYLYNTRGTMIPPNDPLFFNYDGSAPSGYPKTPEQRAAFFDASQSVTGTTPTVFAERIDISEFDDPSKPPGTKFSLLGAGNEFPDYPAIIFNQSTVDIHGAANICGVVFGPAYGEIENKGEGSTPLYHYFCGAVIVGDGIKLKNNASGSMFPTNPPLIGAQWKAQVFIYEPTHLNSLAIEAEFIPGAISSWSFLSTSIRK